MCAAIGGAPFNGYSMLATLPELEPLRPAPPEAEQTARGIAVAAEMEQANDASESALRRASRVESGSPLTARRFKRRANSRGRSTARGAASTSPSFIPAAGGQSAKEQPVEEPPAEEARSGEREAVAASDESIDRKVGGRARLADAGDRRSRAASFYRGQWPGRAGLGDAGGRYSGSGRIC